MNWKQIHTIDGVKDYFDDELDKKIALERGILDAIRKEGFRRIETPSLEYFDVFSNGGNVSSTSLYKIDDKDGNTMVLRPDFTPSIARSAVMYFAKDEFPLHICYKGHTFKNHARYKGHLTETTQIGAEIIGKEEKADANILKVAINSLKDAGVTNFKLNVGHARFFKAFLCEAGITENTDKLIELMSGRNLFGLIAELKALNVKPQLIEIIKMLDEVYETKEELKEASVKCDNFPILKVIFNELLNLEDELTSLGIEKYVSYDLGFVGQYDYYTGIVFAGYVPGNGTYVVKGGRYDNLLESFGENEPAVGFVIDVNLLLDAMNETEAKASKEGYLTFALGKGRLAKKTMEFLEELGYTCEELKDEKTRKLIFTNEEQKTRFFLSKGPDVPTYVEYGAADIGIVGEDTILEEGRDLYEVLDLGFGKCRMCICGPESAREILDKNARIKVATKYPHIAKDYFYNVRHQNVEIIKLNGSIELAPIVGLADVICDIVETGSTLRENGLVVLEEVCPLSARLIINKASMQTQHDRIVELIRGLNGLLEK